MGGAIGVLGIVEREVDDRPVAGAPSARREEDAADAAADYQDTWMGQPVKRLDACGRVFEPDRRVRVFMSPSSADGRNVLDPACPVERPQALTDLLLSVFQRTTRCRQR